MPISRKLLISTYLLSVFRRYSVHSSKDMSGEILSITSDSAAPCISGKHSVAYVTVPNEETARTIAHGLVASKIAACVNIIPKITSIYEWQADIHEDTEVLMMIKTRTSRVDELTEFVKAKHPYSVCEVISVPIQKGNEAYLNWISDVVPEKRSDIGS